MPTEAFINAASAANRQPVVLLAIESVDAIKKEVSGQTKFQACALSNINTTSETNKIRLTTDGVEDMAERYKEAEIAIPNAWTGVPYVVDSGAADGYPQFNWCRSETPVIYSDPNQHICGVRLWIYEKLQQRRRWVVKGRLNGGGWQIVAKSPDPYINWTVTSIESVTVEGLTRGHWEFIFCYDGFWTVGAHLYAGDYCAVYKYQLTHETHYLPTGSITTADTALDLGIIPTIPSRFEVDDVVNTGCSITYTAWGRNTTGAEWTSLGVVSEITPLAPYQYYKIRADLTPSADGMNTPMINSIRIVGGDAQYTYLSTHKDTPIQGALPYIVPGGISSISSKIDLTQQATVGELTAKLYWRKKIGDMVAGDFLKNKTIICKLGFVGLPESDYEPYFVGTWYDYQSDQEKGIITVKTRNILKRFNKKVPAAEEFMIKDPVTGVWSAVANKTVTYSGNGMRVMLNIIDQLAIPSRLINTDSFTALEIGARSGSVAPVGLTPGSDWYVTRTVTEPQDAMEMLNQLSVSSGVFLFEGADGRLTAKLYDDFAADTVIPAATLDATHYKFKPVDAGQKDLYTRSAIYYGLISGNSGGSATDYTDMLLKVNQESEIAWEESNTREWFDYWGISVKAIQLLAARWESWFSVPRATVRVDDLPPRFYGIERGAVVAVNNLQLPCPAEDWQGYTAGTRFLVMGKSISDPTTGNLTVSLDLMQLEAPDFTTDPSFPNYSRLDYWPAVTELTATERFDSSNGVVSSYLDISFSDPTGYTTGSAIVWTRTNGGEWVSHTVIPFGPDDITKRLSIVVTSGDTVEVRVSTLRPDNSQMPISSAPTTTALISHPAVDPTKLLQILNPDTSSSKISDYLNGTTSLIDILDTRSMVFELGVVGSGITATYTDALRQTSSQMNSNQSLLQYLNETVAGLTATEYSAVTTYETGQIVTYLTQTYQCIQTSTGNLPTITTYWAPISGLYQMVSTISSDLNAATGTWTETAATLTGDVADLANPVDGRVTLAESTITHQGGLISLQGTAITGPLAFVVGAVTQSGVVVETAEDIEGIDTAISRVGIDLDSAAASIVIGASRIDNLTGRATAAELAIDGANAAIALRATKDELSGQVSILSNAIGLKVSSADYASEITVLNNAIGLKASSDDLSGEVVVLSDMIGLKLDATGTTGPGMAIGWTDGTHTKSIIRFNTDTLQIGKTDSTGYRNIFTVGDINGVPTVGIDGALVIDGTLSARSIAAGELIVGTNIGLGTAQDSAGVTSIIDGVLTTHEVNADKIISGTKLKIDATIDSYQYVISVLQDGDTSGCISAINNTGDNTIPAIYARCGQKLSPGSADSVAVVGVSYSGYGGAFQGAKGPLKLGTGSMSGTPTHSASKGTIWLDYNCILYVNIDGAMTWQKVGAQ